VQRAVRVDYLRDVNRAFAAMRTSIYAGFSTSNADDRREVHLRRHEVRHGHRGRHGSADVFSEWKSVYVDFSGRLQRAQIDTAEL
jgi:aldehyde dehydrogenase (NAD+)